ncbi:MAG TPA: hypothetical protein VN327_15070 [Pseudonocardiaceae bacterium]|jgi:hypothetical protein|nr:hypothetical protein [Pseudonocardiaceae bacterium]
MATGDPAEAATLGTAALDAACTIRSRRTLGGLWKLNRHAAAHQDVDEVAQLRHRIGTLVLTLRDDEARTIGRRLRQIREVRRKSQQVVAGLVADQLSQPVPTGERAARP